jgi:hypothetical protein
MDIEQCVEPCLAWSLKLTNPRRFRKAGYQAIDRICDYYYSLQDLPVSSQVGGAG